MQHGFRCHHFTSYTRGHVIQDVFVAEETSSGEFDLSDLAVSEVRIVLLYCTQVRRDLFMRKWAPTTLLLCPKAESGPLMAEAARRGLTSPQFMWLATQSVVGDPGDFVGSRTRLLPVGMIGD